MYLRKIDGWICPSNYVCLPRDVKATHGLMLPYLQWQSVVGHIRHMAWKGRNSEVLRVLHIGPM